MGKHYLPNLLCKAMYISSRLIIFQSSVNNYLWWSRCGQSFV